MCNITTEDTYKEIYAVFSRLQTAKRSVWLMGYIDEKAVPFYCLQQLSADYFCKKDLNWFGRPNKVQIEDFCKIDFDIMIDFSHQKFDPIRLMMQITPAHFIVGGNKENIDCYDLLIDSEQELTHNELINEIAKYTSSLSGERP
ncbi:MAG: hypothetical protein J5642_03685 [Bacteroidales bacterium]|nr:hypothetical protein [Bacteroidales bacterium]